MPSIPPRIFRLGDLAILANYTNLGKRLLNAVDELRANSMLNSSEYSIPIWGLANGYEAGI